MNIRSRFVFTALSAILGCTACSSSGADNTPITSAAFGVGTDANSVTGTISALAGNCPALTFMLERRIIKTDASTTFGEGGCAALKNGLRVGIAGVAQSDGSVKASRVGVVVTVTPPPPPPTVPVPVPTGVVGVSGTVASLAGACPVVSFTLENRVIKTDATTAFGDAGCVAVKNGVRAEISGTVQTDGSIKALKVGVVVVVPPPPVPPVPVPVPSTTISVSGAVKSLSGTCPTVSFTLENRSIKTSTSTAFGDGGCAAIKNDVRVAVTGTIQADGSILALKAAVPATTTTPPPPPLPPTPPTAPPPITSISGNITALTGSCPQLIITIGERKAMTSAVTVFEVKACAELAVGSYVEVVGLLASANTALAATKVTGRR